jgi:hypothetical protein
MVTIRVRDEGGVTILEVVGPLVLRDGGRPLHDAAEAQIERGRRRIVIDLCRPWIRWTLGIGDLIGAYTIVTRRGAQALRPSKKISC